MQATAGTGQPPVPSGRLRAGHRPDIEGLRAIAVLLVVAFHAGVTGLSGGFVGVDVFFVLSGFLITGLLADELLRTGAVSFTAFYGRRARRLLPLATVVLVATAVASAAVLSPLDRTGLVADIRAAALYFANWHFAAGSLDYMSQVDKSPVLHYWSLSVEEQFYLLWPVLLVVVTRHGRGRHGAVHPLRRMTVALAVLAAGSLAASILLTPRSEPYSYYGLHTRAWELAAGGLLALGTRQVGRLPVPVRGVAGWAGLAGVLASAFVIGPDTTFPGSAALLPVLSTVLLVAAGGPRVRRGASRLVAARPLTYVGRLSYAWYLWHWPCLVLAGTLVGTVATGADDAGAMVTPAHGWPALAAVAVSFGLSVLSHHLYEDPVRRSAWLAAVRHRSLVLGASLTTATVALAGVVLPVGSAAVAGPTRAVTAPRPVDRVAHARTTGHRPDHAATTPAHVVDLKESPEQARADKPGARPGCTIGHNTTVPGADCQFGDPNGTVRVALVGDSHAHQWLPALSGIARRRHWQLWMFEKPSCPMIPLTVRLPLYHDAYPACAAYRDNVVARLRAMGGVDAVVVAHFSGYPHHLGTADNRPLSYDQAVRAWGPAWAAMSRTLHEVADKVVLIRDGPRSPRDVPSCLAEHPHDAEPCSFARGPGFADSTALYRQERANAADTDAFVDLTGLVCPPAETTCPVIWYDGTIMYRDSHHMTTWLSKALAPELARRLVPVVEGHR